MNAFTKEINDELLKSDLSIESTKTEAEVITKKRNSRKRNVKIKVIDHPIVPSSALRYLGVWLDNNGTFNTHVEKKKKKL